MIADYLATFDFNMPIIDAVNDPDLAGARSELAALALGEGLDSGYYEAQELAEAFLEAAREANAEITDPESPARERSTSPGRKALPETAFSAAGMSTRMSRSRGGWGATIVWLHPLDATPGEE